MSDARVNLEQYLSMFAPLKLLPRGPTMTEEAALRWLVDEAFRAGREMIHVHTIESKFRFVKLARVMESHGYYMTWYKHKGTVGATKKGVVHDNITSGNGKPNLPG